MLTKSYDFPQMRKEAVNFASGDPDNGLVCLTVPCPLEDT